MEKVNIKNVVLAKKTIEKVYPFGWDCGALADALMVVWFEDNQFKTNTFIIDERFGYDYPATKVNIKWIDNVEEMQQQYNDYLKQQRIDESKKERHSLNAQIGDIIEVYRGRKYPKGTRFVVKSESVWKDCYGRPQTYYWVTECGKKVDQFNCIIVG